MQLPSSFLIESPVPTSRTHFLPFQFLRVYTFVWETVSYADLVKLVPRSFSFFFYRFCRYLKNVFEWPLIFLDNSLSSFPFLTQVDSFISDVKKINPIRFYQTKSGVTPENATWNVTPSLELRSKALRERRGQ